MTRVSQSLLLALAAAALACGPPPANRDIPPGQLYFPTGMFFAAAAGDERAGALLVASSNFDRRYELGRLTAIDVASLACGTAPAGACLPDFPAPAAAPLEIASLGTVDEKDLSSLAGEVDGIARGDGSYRVLVPSRAEGSLLQAVDVAGAQLTCAGDPTSTDCSVGATSLEANRRSSTGVPRTPSPFSVSISKPDGEAWVTSLQLADSPAASGTNAAAYTVHLNAFDPVVTNDQFLNLGTVPTESVVTGKRYAFMSGFQTLALRLIDRQTTRLLNAFVEANFNLGETRGLALSSDESQLFLLGRGPDSLLVMSVAGSQSDNPLLSLTHAELLPLGASQVKVLDKPSGGHLAVVSCLGTQNYDAVGATQGSLVIWDDQAGVPVAALDGFGFQPYGLAYQRIGNGARLYVGLFGEGRIAVLDLPDLDRPEDVRLVARLGTSHVCVVNPSARGCTEPTP